MTQIELDRPAEAAEPPIRLEDHLGLLGFWAAKLARPGLEYDDLVQDGYFGLAKAVERYDPEVGVRFSTYASIWIRQAMQRGTATLAAGPVSLPPEIQTARRQTQAASDHLESLGRPTEPAALAEASGLPATVVERVLNIPQATGAHPDEHPDASVSTDEVEARLRRLDVDRALDRLEGPQRELISLRYGVRQPPCPVGQIPERLALTIRGYRRTHAEALSTLADVLAGYEG